jgi:hypothetical protein
MPQEKHLRGVGEKEQRIYENIKARRMKVATQAGGGSGSAHGDEVDTL